MEIKMETKGNSSKKTAGEITYDSLWKEIEKGVREIHMSKPMNYERFIDLYSKVYDFCTSRSQLMAPMPSENGTRGKSRQNNVAYSERENCGSGSAGHGQGQMYFIGRKLYDLLEGLLQNILQDKADVLVTKSGFETLKAYNEEWDRFTVNSKAVNKVFSYLNRHWIHHGPGENKEGSKPFQIYHLSIDTWKNIVFEPLNRHLVSEILHGLKRDRLEDSIENKAILKHVIYSFVSLGLTSDSQSHYVSPRDEEEEMIWDSWTGLRLNPELYSDGLEVELILSTKEHYINLANSHLSSHTNNFTEYMKMVETQLVNEEERTRFYLPSLSFQRIITVCNDVLIRNQLEQFKLEFVTLLCKEQHGELARAYSLVNRLGNELAPFCKAFTEQATVQGRNAITALVENNKASRPAMDPKRYIDALLEVHHKYKSLIAEAFENNTSFISALDMACESFVNNNAVTQTPNSSQKSAELLARYCDGFLRKSSRNCDDKSIDDVMDIFKFLTDKDAFQTYYTLQLANRLVNQISSNDDAEQLMLTKLKLHNGFEYTTKLMRMYQDITISKDLYDEFKRYMATNHISLAHDFQPQILTSGSWPFKYPNCLFAFPEELEPPIQNFVQFYNGKHNGRKLVWLYSRCKGEIHATCYATPHIFQLSIFQMAILLIFNNGDRHRLDEILETTKLLSETALQVIDTLVSANLLICKTLPQTTPLITVAESSKQSPNNDEAIPDKIYTLNLNYNNPKYRVVLPSTLQFEQKLEKDKSEFMIKEGRKLLIQACIVRIMKMRQSMKHKMLEMEVMEQTHKQFHPDASLIRKCIELLIEKEYLKRSDEDLDTYLYIT